MDAVEIFGLIFFTVDIVYNSLTIKYRAGKKLITLEEILSNYLSTTLVVDIMNVLILAFDLSS